MIVPCIWLDDQAEAAAALYTRTFPGGRETGRSYYPEAGANPAGKDPGSLLTVEVELAGQPFTLLNGGPMFKPNQTVSFFVICPDPADVDRIVGALLEGGFAMMELGEYPWSPRYAWVADRYGVSWQVMAGDREEAATTYPCLMFNGQVEGRAEEALRQYAQVLGGEVLALEHYAPDAGPAGLLVHGRAAFGSGELVTMDSPISHGVAFTEGVSLQVLAEDQQTLDRWWDGLVDGGQPGPCGWLTDRYGLSWQVVPAAAREWLASPDVAARDRVFQAIMPMGKLDVAALEAAFRG